jgi:hypothetical protein
MENLSDKLLLKRKRKEKDIQIVEAKKSKPDLQVSAKKPKEKAEKVSETAEPKKVSNRKKRKFHHNHQKKRKTSESETVARLPDKPEVISCNWKNLLKTLDTEKGAKKPNPKAFFSAARKKKMNEGNAYSVQREEAKKIQPVVEKKKPEIWFDDVDECLLDPEDRPNLAQNDSIGLESIGNSDAENALVKENAFKG